jgi:DNA-binding response OmpR family regulator
VLRALARRKQVLRGQAQSSLRLDYARCLLEGPTGEAKLTEAEARVLAALSSARAHTLERWQVAAQFDPNSEDMSADNLQNRLSQLRKKLCSCGAQGESIRAIRNLGYRLCVPLSVF